MAEITVTGPATAGTDEGRYRGLKLFWGTVLTAVVGTAATLQILGPVPRAGARPAVQASASTSPPTPSPAAAAAPAPNTQQSAVAAPDPALQEAAPDFGGHTLPVMGPNGRASMVAYAAPFDLTDKHPKIALVVDGAGLDEQQTKHLISDLPGAVDIAFSAYTQESQEQPVADAARAAGHECLLSIPMAPAGYPLSEEGPRSLLEGVDPEQNSQNLEWALSRIPGCVGATGASDGLMGERFAQSGQAFAPVLSEVSKRGLLYLDPRTGAPALYDARVGTIMVADMIIDAPASAEQPATAELIDQRLAALEKLASERGTAIGLAGPPKPVLLERIAVWAHGLAARGLTLAPLTSLHQEVVKPAAEDDPTSAAAAAALEQSDQH